MTNLFLQIFVLICFLGVVVILFFEERDYIYYTFIFILLGGLATAVFIPETRELKFYIEIIEWEVIFFLITMFTIVEILKENKVFDEIARLVVVKYQNNLRAMFYIICIISTLLATIVEDLSIALIFAPVIIVACRKLNIKPAAYLLGMTICINIAATLTPFGSAQNILISNEFGLEFLWFVIKLGPYFVIALISTLILLDKFTLKNDINFCASHACAPEEIEGDTLLTEPSIEKPKFILNLIGLVIFIILLIIIPEIYLAGLIGALIFVLINPVENRDGKKKLSLSKYLSHVDYKLIYFFMALFIFVGLLEANGIILFIENIIANVSAENEFVLAIIILISTSILSGLIDNTPVTIIFIPIVRFLFNLPEFYLGPIVVAFILGINLGGNFLPQGSAADLATLEISRDNQVDDMSYRRLFKVGGVFALFHILLGIGYIALLVFVF
ncbi:MAG: putative Arsenical pump membrane protein [Promethearchaeota archaeon]|nr:MAG: putative Arsenical pump membrane protein [Candidatus Lokiarchaeota archaeon]